MIDELVLGGRRHFSLSKMANKVGVSPDTVEALCREGKIASQSIGGRWYISEEAIPSLAAHAGLDVPAAVSSVVSQVPVQAAVVASGISLKAAAASLVLVVAGVSAVTSFGQGILSQGVSALSSLVFPKEASVAAVGATTQSAAAQADTGVTIQKEELQKFEAKGFIVAAPLYAQAAPSKAAPVTEKIIYEQRVISVPAPAFTVASQTGDLITRAEFDLRIKELSERIALQYYSLQDTFSTSQRASSGFGYQTLPSPVSQIALTQKIDQLTGVSLSDVRVDGITGLTDEDIPDQITLTSSGPLSAASASFTGSLSAGVLSISTTTATSTFASGIDIASGCFAISGVCVSSGSGSGNVSGSGSVSQLTFWTGASMLSGNDTLVWDTSNFRLGLGTTSPGTRLGVTGDAVIAGTTTVGQLTSTSTLLVSGTATSTFSGGIVSAGLSTSQGVTITGGSLNIEVAATSTSNNGFNIVNGCYAWRGICISGSGGGGTIIGGGTLGQVSFFDGMQSIASDSTFLFDSSLDLLTILNASSTRFSAISYIKVGGTATSTISGNNGLSTLSSDLLVTGSTTLQNVTALSATTTNATTTSLAITGGFQVTSLGTSTFTGGLSTAGVASSQGVTISGGNLLISSVATSSLAGGLSTAGLSSSQGLVISGGNILSTSAATSTFANGLNISAGCFATSLGCVGQAAGTVLDAALSANVALLNRTSQIFTGDNTFNAAGTALTVSNTAAIGTLTITGSATSTSVGGFITSAGYDGKFATLQQILLGSGSATSSITGGATSTFSGGAAASGLSSSNGITLSGGIITQSNTATNTLSSISAAGLAASNGLTLTGGRLRITSTATSSLANGISLSAGCFATSLGCVGQAAGTVQDAALSSNVALLDRSSQSFTGTNTFTNNVTFGKELTLTGTGTSTSVGGFSTVKGYDGKFATLQQILLGSGSATSSITGGATSTFSGGIAGAGISSSNGLTLTGGKFAITGSATSTANNGFNLSAGCFAVNDVCVGSGAGTITGSGTSGQITFWSGASAITGDLSFVWDNTTKFFGLGTSTPSGRLSVANNPGATTPAFIISTTTAANATSTAFIVDSNGKVGIGTSSPSAQLAIAGNIYAAGTATNTFAGGINITSGCLAINGTCFASGNKYFAAYATSSHGGTTTIVFSGTAGSQPSFDASTDTLTLPSDTAQIEVEVWGGGGGGGGDAVNGTTGGQTCLSTNAADACASPLASATGGGGGLSTGSVTGGTPGTGVTGDLILSGSAGNSGYYFHDTGNAWGGTGGAAPRGGGGGRGGQQALNGGDGYPYGGGGGGSGTDVVGNTGASGGGGGGYAQKIIAPPASAYYFTLGVGGAGAVATPAGGKAGAGGFNVKVFTSTAGTGVAGGWIDDGTVVRLQTSADKVAIGTSTPYAGLTVWGQDTASTTKLFEFTNNASTTLFSLTNAGTATFGVANNAANFGIGATSTPFARLSIAGQANHNIALFAVSKSTASATSTAFLIDSNGRIGVGTTTASDLALGFADNFGFLGLPKFTTAQRGGLIGNSTSTGSVIFNTTTGRPEFFDGANWIGITATSGPTFSADNSANITFTANGGTGAANVTPYDTVNFDTNNNFTKCTSNCTGTGPTPAISKFTPTVAGKYIFTASFIFQSPDAAARTEYVQLRKNDSSLLDYQFQPCYALNACTFSLTAVVDMNGTTDFVNTRYGADGTDAGWILYGANANDIAFSGALVQPAGPIGGNGISSDARLKQDIEYLGGNSLDILGQISPASFAYITEPTQKRFGFIAQDLQRVIPEAVFQLSNDPFLRIDPTAILSHSVRAIQQLASTTAAIQNDYATSTDPVIRVDFSGNLAFGTTSPLTIWNSGVVTIGTSTVATSTHKLIVGGDIAATGFINISTEASKKDIEHLTEDEEAGILEKVKNTSVATYRYKSESATSTLRLGLIAEEAPEEVLSSDGKGVDIYKLSSFALAGIKAQQSQIEKMQLGIAGLSAVAGTLGSSTGTMLSDLGILFSNGITYIKNLAVETFKIGSPEKPSGVTLFDVDTGAPYCVVLKGGVLTPTAGECTTVPSSVSVPSEPPAQSVVGEEPIDTEAPVITLIGAAHITLEKGVSFIDPGATVADNVNSNLGVQAVGAEVDTNTVGDHIITYDATDSAGNKATQVTRTVTITGPVAVEEAASEAPPETPEAPEATEVPVAE